MSAVKVYKFHLGLTIPNNQLVWSRHAKERMEQRKVSMPETRARWGMIEKRWSDEHKRFTMTLRLKRKGQQDLIIVTSRRMGGGYFVITTYWDESEVAA